MKVGNQDRKLQDGVKLSNYFLKLIVHRESTSFLNVNQIR